ncbi:hypothetical protein D3C87_955350 [compost metagenome]
MNYVYLLQHSYEIGEFEETKIIGIYSSKEKAKNIINIYKKLPGFNNYPKDCFHISKYQIDKDNWEEGFITWDEAYKEEVNE